MEILDVRQTGIGERPAEGDEMSGAAWTFSLHKASLG
jgi:hypothetical protein